MGVGASHAALIDRGGGLIYDDVKNLTWLQDTRYVVTSGYSATGLPHLGRRTRSSRRTSEYLDSVRGRDVERLAPPDRGELAGFGRVTTRAVASSELAFMYYVNLGLSPVYRDGSRNGVRSRTAGSTNLDRLRLLDRHRSQAGPFRLGIPVRLRLRRSRRARLHAHPPGWCATATSRAPPVTRYPNPVRSRCSRSASVARHSPAGAASAPPDSALLVVGKPRHLAGVFVWGIPSHPLSFCELYR